LFAVLNAGLLSCDGNICAGESTTDDVDGGKSGSCADIVKPHGVGPVFRENAAAPLVDLDLPDRAGVQGALEAQLQAAHTGE
jgi:hypothetical protein